MKNNVKLITNTVRHMNFRQIKYRLKYECIKKIKNKVKISNLVNYNEDYIYYVDDLLNTNEDDTCIKLSEDICKGKFTFLNNLTYEFEDEICWKVNPFNYRLWTFNLNYFNFLNELSNSFRVTNNDKYLKKGIELIFNWINSNGNIYDKDIWDPYVLSIRVFNWINFISYNKKNISEDVIKRINIYIDSQLRFLNKNFEYYLDCNHLLMDAKGLLVGGVYLNNNKYIEKACKVFDEEYNRQFTNDGFHYENSPSYQAEVLDNYLTAYIVLIKNKKEKNAEKIKLNEKCIKIADALYQYMDNEGNIPLLNDSSLDYPLFISDILQIACLVLNRPNYKCKLPKKLSNRVVQVLGKEYIEKYINIEEKAEIHDNLFISQNGYVFIEDKNFRVIFDCGNGGPDYNLGHTHADNLNIIMQYNNSNIIEDAGTYTYKKSKERNIFRSTKYHNTIEIDGKSSSEIWSAFRVAKRAKTKILNIIENRDYYIITAEHDGYTKVLKNDSIYHERTLVFIKNKGIIIIDKIKGEIKDTHKYSINYNISDKITELEHNFKIGNDIIFNSNIEFLTKKRNISRKFSELTDINLLQSENTFSDNSVIVTSFIIKNQIVDYEIHNNNIIVKFKNERVVI